MSYEIHEASEIGRLNRSDMPYSDSIAAAESIAYEIAPYSTLDPIIESMSSVKREWGDRDARSQLAQTMLDAIGTIASGFKNAYIDMYACPDGKMDATECQSLIVQSTHQAIAWETAPYPNMMRAFTQFLYDIEEAVEESDNEMLAAQHNEEHMGNDGYECYGCDEYSDAQYGYGGYDYGMTGYGDGGGTGSPEGGADERIEQLCRGFIDTVIDYERKTAAALGDTVFCCNAILNGQVDDGDEGNEPDPYADWKAMGWGEFFD